MAKIKPTPAPTPGDSPPSSGGPAPAPTPVSRAVNFSAAPTPAGAPAEGNGVATPAPTPGNLPPSTSGPTPAPVPVSRSVNISAAPTPANASAEGNNVATPAPTPGSSPVANGIATPAPVPKVASDSLPVANVLTPVPSAAAEMISRMATGAALNPNPSMGGFDQKKHDDEDIKTLYQIYLSRRLQAQIDFYNSRIRENDKNSDFSFRAGALILTVSALIATISASVSSQDDQVLSFVLKVLAAVLPAFAALIASFRQLYGWDKQATIYRDSLLGLERVSLLTPDDDRLKHTDLAPIYPELVKRAEGIFNSEISQWGQFVLSKDKAAGEGERDTVAKSAVNFDLSPEQIKTMQAIFEVAQKGNVSLQSTTLQTTDVVVEAEVPADTSKPNAEPATVVATLSAQTEVSTSAPIPFSAAPTMPAPTMPAPALGKPTEDVEALEDKTSNGLDKPAPDDGAQG